MVRTEVVWDCQFPISKYMSVTVIRTRVLIKNKNPQQLEFSLEVLSFKGSVGNFYSNQFHVSIHISIQLSLFSDYEEEQGQGYTWRTMSPLTNFS